ncbi:hypothetical protein DB347_15700 [Opitutaceae bacterium EW11]|nr:hypothetical protein DB347_15700 [Opitutaceae bacterium EW11]
MNRLRLALASLFATAVAVSAGAESDAPGFFLEPSLGYAILSDYDYVFGPEIAFGYRLDAVNRIAVETAYYATRASVLKDDIELVPLLIRYDREVQLAPKWTGTVGLVGGALFQRFENHDWLFPLVRRHDEEKTHTAGALGGEVGIDYHLNDRVSLGVSATVLALTSTDIVTSNALAVLRFKAGIAF